MAGEEIVEIVDDSVVVIDLPADMLAALEDDADNPLVVVKPDTPQRHVAAPVVRERKSSAADEAAAALTKSLQAAEEGRRTAEQTAANERAGRLEAERQANLRATEARGFREQAENHEASLITSGIESATRDIASAKAEWAVGFEAGDANKMNDAQERMGKATAALDRLEANKATYEARRAAAPDPQPQTFAPINAMDAYISKYPNPRDQAFLRAHPDCLPTDIGGNPQKNALMVAGHNIAIARNITPGTDEYYRTVEETISGAPVSAAATVTPAAAASDPPRRQAPAARQAPISAPVSRDPPSSSPTLQQGRFSLNKEMQEIALISFPARGGESIKDHQKRAFGEYANEYVLAVKDGKLGRRHDGM